MLSKIAMMNRIRQQNTAFDAACKSLIQQKEKDAQPAPQITVKFHPERALPDRVREDSSEKFGKNIPGIRHFELERPAGYEEISVYEESPGVFREPLFGYPALILALMHAGLWKDCRIPVAEYLDLDELAVTSKGHLDLKVVDGYLEVSLRKHREKEETNA